MPFHRRETPERAARLLSLIVLVAGVLLAPVDGTVRQTGAAAAAVEGPPSWASSRPSPDPVGVWPLVPEPDVVRDFDPPAQKWGSGHRGVDLRGRVGQPVRSALAGRVSYAGRLAGRGVVAVTHPDGTRTTYEPVAARVRVGQQVPKGGRIGVLERAGSHCSPSACLHWGWLRGETYLDPLDLVGGGPVRLLPLWRDLPVGSAGPWRPLAARWPSLVAVAGLPVLTPGGAPGGRPAAAGPW